MCNKKVRLITAIIVASSVLMFSGCGKDASTTEPVISDAVEETEPTEEVDDTEEIVESEDTEDSSENTVESDNDSSNENSSIGGEDTKTDEEIEAELEETYGESSNNTTVDNLYDFNPDADASLYDENGINKETGQYNPNFDTNGGQGWDIGGIHYETKGEYYDNFEQPEDAMTEEGWNAFLEKMKN